MALHVRGIWPWCPLKPAICMERRWVIQRLRCTVYFPSVISTLWTGFFYLAIIKGPPNDIYFIIEGPCFGYFTEKISQALCIIVFISPGYSYLFAWWLLSCCTAFAAKKFCIKRQKCTCKTNLSPPSYNKSIISRFLILNSPSTRIPEQYASQSRSPYG